MPTENLQKKKRNAIQTENKFDCNARTTDNFVFRNGPICFAETRKLVRYDDVVGTRVLVIEYTNVS